MYRVVKFFTDLQDNNHAYNVGDEFPREGMSVDVDRINLLLSGNNRQGTPLIKEENAVETPKEEIEEPKEEVADPEVVETVDGKETEDSLSGMTTKEIKALAAERGYKITKFAKSDVIEQFLKQQG